MDALVKYFKLVSNIFEKFDGEIEKFSITSSVNMKPCTRSIFILEKYLIKIDLKMIFIKIL